jgi:RNA polymerase sigma-32 factor
MGLTVFYEWVPNGTTVAHVKGIPNGATDRAAPPPAGIPQEAALQLSTLPSSSGSLAMYLSEINQFPLLTQEEEQRLARLYRKSGNMRAAHILVTANLRFVVKVSYEYRSYGIKMGDLIQEGNIGLMKAVEKFDADKDIRLISYAVWWIRAYIQNYILKSWSLVKLGTTQAQRKLFFSLARTKRELEKMHASGTRLDTQEIANRLRVKPSEVQEMEQRMEGRDLSLDAPMGEDGGNSHVDFVAGSGAPQDEELSSKQERALVNSKVEVALKRLDQRERFIIEMRVMSDKPMTLKELGEHFGFSRERARQLEIRAKDKLREELEQLASELGIEGGTPVELPA